MRVVVPRKILASCLQGASNSHPEEFLALLSGSVVAGAVRVSKLYLAPLATATEESVLFDFLQLPLTAHVVGTFHSHPNGVLLPSRQDLFLFSKHGSGHLISGAPYSLKDVRAYDFRGKPAVLEVKT